MDVLNQSEITQQVDTAIESGQLLWGRSYLMCPPEHFGVLYEINPWMKREVRPDRDLAYEQWHNLVANLRLAGATVKTMQPIESLPDLVFAANAGLVDGRRFIVSRFRHPERQPEAAYDAEWFQAENYRVVELPDEPNVYFEGVGDAFPFRGRLLAGYGFRSSTPAHAVLTHLLGVEVISVKLVDPRIYHFDISFCPLDERHAIIAPLAWDRQSCEAVRQVVPEPLVLEDDEALTFCANSVVVGKTVIMPCCTPRIARILEGWGFDICVSPLTEFIKAGGAARCLTLALDMTVGRKIE